MSNKYHTLLVRDNAAEPWGIHFGDYDLECVKDERDAVTQWEYKRSDTRIVTHASDNQAVIDARVKALNGEVA